MATSVGRALYLLWLVGGSILLTYFAVTLIAEALDPASGTDTGTRANLVLALAVALMAAVQFFNTLHSSETKEAAWDHQEEAGRLLRRARRWQNEHPARAQLYATMANTHATLALQLLVPPPPDEEE